MLKFAFLILGFFLSTEGAWARDLAGTELCVIAHPASHRTFEHVLIYYKGNRHSMFQNLVLETGAGDSHIAPYKAGKAAVSNLMSRLKITGAKGFCYQLSKAEEARFSGLLYSEKHLTEWMIRETSSWKLFRNNCADFVRRVFFTVTGEDLLVFVKRSRVVASPGGIMEHLSQYENAFQKDGRAVTLLSQRALTEHLLR